MAAAEKALDMTFGLDGKVALVTGGASGIGAAIADTYALKGAKVAVVDVNGEAADAKARELGDGSAGFTCDVSDPAAVGSAVTAVLETYGRIDILVNSAGVAILAPAEDLEPGAFDTTININLKGTFLVCQEVGRHMLAMRLGEDHQPGVAGRQRRLGPARRLLRLQVRCGRPVQGARLRMGLLAE